MFNLYLIYILLVFCVSIYYLRAKETHILILNLCTFLFLVQATLILNLDYIIKKLI